MKLKALALATGLLASGVTQAQIFEDSIEKEPQYDKEWKVVMSFGIQNGGDEIETLTAANSEEIVFEEELRAGGFVHFELGVILPLGESDFSVQLTGGLLRDRIFGSASDEDMTFRRKTVELIPFYNWGRHRVGLGYAQHFEPKLSYRAGVIGTDITRGTAEFDDAGVGILQYDYRFDENLLFGARLSSTEYEHELLSEPLNGDAVGVHVSYSF